MASDRASAITEPAAEDLSELPQLLRRAGVGEIILVHGTFAGTDVVGVVREIARFSPSLARRLGDLGKRWFDELAGEVGNYTATYAQCLTDLVNPPSLEPILVSRFPWTGENHHLGRADGAMLLIERLLDDAQRRGRRILVLAHSHGGNMVAMLSHLVGASSEEKQAFFGRTRLHYKSYLFRRIDLPTWQHVQEGLAKCDPSSFPRLDVATFGTPLRYRWNTGVCENLLHFVHHRPLDPSKPQAACIPAGIQQLLDAAGGDYVQHLGIAGTDFLPSVFAWRDWIVERRMGQIFECHARRSHLMRNLKVGRRTSADGVTLLVDYADTDEGWNRKLFGHGVYTCRQWLPFHLKEIAERFYTTRNG